jgi:hypothetical protein
LKLRDLDEKTCSGGSDGKGRSADIGVSVVDLVVGGRASRSDGNGPVTVGYSPVP